MIIDGFLSGATTDLNDFKGSKISFVYLNDKDNRCPKCGNCHAIAVAIIHKSDPTNLLFMIYDDEFKVSISMYRCTVCRNDYPVFYFNKFKNLFSKSGSGYYGGVNIEEYLVLHTDIEGSVYLKEAENYFKSRHKNYGLRVFLIYDAVGHGETKGTRI